MVSKLATLRFKEGVFIGRSTTQEDVHDAIIAKDGVYCDVHANDGRLQKFFFPFHVIESVMFYEAGV